MKTIDLINIETAGQLANAAKQLGYKLDRISPDEVCSITVKVRLQKDRNDSMTGTQRYFEHEEIEILGWDNVDVVAKWEAIKATIESYKAELEAEMNERLNDHLKEIQGN